MNRNKKRFPSDFMFIVTNREIETMVSQGVIPSKQHLGGASPYAFTEQGVAMLFGVLHSETAVRISIQIMNAFVNMRRFIASNADIFQRLDRVERKQIDYTIQCYEVEQFQEALIS